MAGMVSAGDDQEKVIPLWLRRTTSTNFYSSCETHRSQERNLYCKVCMVALCEKCKCKKRHDLFEHEIIKAYKVRKDASFRIEDLKSLWDISHICPYISNKWTVAYIKRRGAGISCSRGQTGIVECESCQYQLKSSGFKYCSVECKVEAVMKMNEGEVMKNEAKTKVDTISDGSVSNVKSFRKRPRKQKHPQRSPLF